MTIRLGDAVDRAKRLTYENVAPATSIRMQAVRGRNTEPELKVRKILHALGYRFRLHRKNLPGTPDIVLPKYRKLVLVHGCFWHGHEGCPRATRPKRNVDAWNAKIEGNKARDQSNVCALQSLGWGVLIIWECEIRELAKTADRLRSFLSG